MTTKTSLSNCVAFLSIILFFSGVIIIQFWWELHAAKLKLQKVLSQKKQTTERMEMMYDELTTPQI